MSRYSEFQQNGYFVEPQLFGAGEVEHLREHYMELRARGSHPGDFEGVDPSSDDPLKKYPRMIHMHRWDETSLHWMLDSRLGSAVADALGQEPYAVQTMVYFKAPGSRGQALHQDQFYLRASPGTCIGAWLALDDADEANGCMQVVAGSHRWPLLCTEKADTRTSFTDVTVPLPDGVTPTPIVMKAGDVLFFHGLVVHGSFPNETKDRFRRSLIAHYVTSESKEIGDWYQPVLRLDGSEVQFAKAPYSGPCGIWAGAGVTMLESDPNGEWQPE